MKRKEIFRPEKRRVIRVIIISFGIILAGTILAILAANGLSIPCILNKLTGLECPGCGNTRAAMALLKFDIASAFKYNMLFIPEFFYLGFVYVSSAVNYLKGGAFSYKSPFKALDVIFLIVFVLWGIVRNFI